MRTKAPSSRISLPVLRVLGRDVTVAVKQRGSGHKETRKKENNRNLEADFLRPLLASRRRGPDFIFVFFLCFFVLRHGIAL